LRVDRRRGYVAVPAHLLDGEGMSQLSLGKLAHRFHLGLYGEGDSKLYVNSVLGTTGRPIRGVAPAPFSRCERRRLWSVSVRGGGWTREIE
jgi:hypothetical protein